MLRLINLLVCGQGRVPVAGRKRLYSCRHGGRTCLLMVWYHEGRVNCVLGMSIVYQSSTSPTRRKPYLARRIGIGTHLLYDMRAGTLHDRRAVGPGEWVHAYLAIGPSMAFAPRWPAWHPVDVSDLPVLSAFPETPELGGLCTSIYTPRPSLTSLSISRVSNLCVELMGSSSSLVACGAID